MKKLIILLSVALSTGLGAGTAVTYMRVSEAAAADSTKAATVAEDESSREENETSDAPSSARADSFVTPAESLRAAIASRNSSSNATPKLMTAAKSDTARIKTTTPAPATQSAAPDKASPTTANAATTQAAAAIVKAVRDSAIGGLPEQRLAKIFAQMQARNAAKVLEQMEDGDIRSVLSLMGDRQAAAILSAFPPVRAAAITKGAIKAPGEDHERD